MRFSTLASAAALFELSIAGYVLEDDYMKDFYNNFDFFTGTDPTEGFVKYIDQAAAKQSGLINGSSTAVAHFGVDTQNKTPGGRPSIRIESKKKYNNGLIVLDVAHMPVGCGTWPAFWTLGPNWPKGGEIDILEGVNEETNNAMTLHTSPGCAIGSDKTQFSGEVSTPNCDVNAQGQSKNAGCSIKHPSSKSYGAGLNQNGGGVYATQWNSDAISVYFFPRGQVPADALSDNPNPKNWGKPSAKFAGACDIDSMFKEQKIIIDTTFCGQWAGSQEVWNGGSCAKKAATCNDFVRDHPEAFKEAYWKINALKVYQDNGKPIAAPSAPVVPSRSIAITTLAPAPTITGGFPVNPPPPSSKPAAPVPSSVKAPGAPAPSKPVEPVPSSAIAPGAPPKPTTAPASPLPVSNNPAPGNPTNAPLENTLQSKPAGSPASAKPPQPAHSEAAQPAQPVKGPGGMPGFQWPVGGGQPQNNAPSAAPGDGSIPTTSAAGAVATPVNNAPKPSSAPAITSPAAAAPAPATPSSAVPAEPVEDEPAEPETDEPAEPAQPAQSAQPAEPVTTVFNTVYITVTAGKPAATPAPAPETKAARLARHARLHRRRSQHHARV